jgi:subtilisin family serine protease
MTPHQRHHLPGKILVQLKPGHELEGVHAHRDVRLGHAHASPKMGGGKVEQVIRKYGQGLEATRAFVARRTLDQPGRRHLQWEALEHELGLSRTFRVAVDPRTPLRALCQELSSLAEVEMASPQYLCSAPFAVPQEPEGDPDDSRAMIGAADALAGEPGDAALIVATVDSGAADLHPDLAGRLRPGLNVVTAQELETGVQLLSGPRKRQDSKDDEGHGTAVAGIIGARGIGVPRGLAGAAEVLPVRALCGARMPGDSYATAIGNLADIDSGLKSAVDLGARVLNLSFGTPQASLDQDDPVPHVPVVRYALSRECVLVSAAGNSGEDELFFPAALPGVIAVGSVGSDRRRSSFSTGGPHVVLCAPGENVRVLSLTGYARMSGTSFSAPLVTAAAALMISRAARRSSPLTAVAVRDLLARSASPFAPGDSRTSRATCGTGILDVPAALAAVEEEIAADAA